MTPEDVRDRVAEIAKIDDSPRLAHEQEDDLYLEVLTCIAAGVADDPAECAKEVIKTQDLNFARWCA